MKKKISGAKTPLERHVQSWINGMAGDYGDGAKGVVSDLLQGGCQSGIVNHLVYYTDTVKFFKKHKKEISEMLKENMESLGVDGPLGLFGTDKWDASDPLAMENLNQNLLAWFGFEETARKLAEENGIEI